MFMTPTTSSPIIFAVVLTAVLVYVKNINVIPAYGVLTASACAVVGLYTIWPIGLVILLYMVINLFSRKQGT